MKKLSFTVATAAVVVGMVLLCTACQFDGQKIVDQFLLGSYGTYSWNSGNTELTIISNEKNFQTQFVGSGHTSVTLKKETVNGTAYLTSPSLCFDAKDMGGGVWQGIFYLNGYGFRTIKITLKSGGRCEIQPGLSVEEGIKFPEDLTVKGTCTQVSGSAVITSKTGMPTYSNIFFNSIKHGSYKTTWGTKTVTTFIKKGPSTVDVEGDKKIVTDTWEGSSDLFKKGTDINVYYKRIYTYNKATNAFISGKFEIRIPKNTVLPANLE
ncbi:hypothetical protein OE909_05745 [Treponema denticola]|uniref:hypothetical protein n=1 Tax=Treponema denticola TaxID=158 RepID=UPI0021F8669A|nr:hypothetical protein [Treponema denticola]UYT08946.1 hypothetical protein OE909_05745 [Treponema denticola]